MRKSSEILFKISIYFSSRYVIEDSGSSAFQKWPTCHSDSVSDFKQETYSKCVLRKKKIALKVFVAFFVSILGISFVFYE